MLFNSFACALPLRTSSKQYEKSSDLGWLRMASQPCDRDFSANDEEANARNPSTPTRSKGVIAEQESLSSPIFCVMFLRPKVAKILANCSSISASLSRILKQKSPPWPVTQISSGSPAARLSFFLLRVWAPQKPMMLLATRQAWICDWQQSTSTPLKMLVYSPSWKERVPNRWFFSQHGCSQPMCSRMSSSLNPFCLRCWYILTMSFTCRMLQQPIELDSSRAF